MNSNRSIYVFVYGSLKRGFHNEDYLEGAEFLCKSETKKRYKMISMGSFPAVTDEPEYFIEGEVFKIDGSILASLDFLESNGRFYRRELVQVIGCAHRVWMYFLIDASMYQANRVDTLGMRVKSDSVNWVRK